MTFLWCLHGNLQRPEVWEGLRENLESPQLIFKLENLMTTEATGFAHWTESFCEKVASYSQGNHVLLGYSLGGRLALHALLECPALWSGAIVVGADPGLKSEEAREVQLQRDRIWAERWLREAWESLWQAWDAQGVFAGRRNETERPEWAYSRPQIARVFEIFSKGHQADLRPRLADLKAPPILYLSGEDDAKYRALGDELEAICPALSHKVIKDAAHRVPWENLVGFTEEINLFLHQIGVKAQTS